jgi:hypothetical protein
MYGLPANYDASFFIGREVSQVCFSVNAIDVIFEGDVLITLRAAFIHMRTTLQVDERAYTRAPRLALCRPWQIGNKSPFRADGS